MKALLNFLLISTFLISSYGCKNTDKTSLRFKEEDKIIAPVETVKETDQTYLSLNEKIFKVSCTKCHNPETAAKKKRVDLTKKKLILENYDDIIYRMTDAFDMGFDYMPEEGGPVSNELIAELKAWKASLDQAPPAP